MLNNSFKCKLCYSSLGTLIYDKVRESEDYKIYCCNKCNHLQIFPLPEEKDNKEFYNTNSQAAWVRPEIDINKMRQTLNTDTNRRTDFIKKIIDPSDSIVEIGTGYGFFLESMKKEGYKIEGIEISRDRRKIAEELNKINIFDIDLCNINTIPNIIKNRFNLAVAFQVFEHILEPLKFLKGISSLLKPKGKIIIEVPNRNDHMIETSDEYKSFYYQKAHVSYYNFNDTYILLKEAGFKNINSHFIQRYSVENCMNWVTNGKPQINSPSFYCNNKKIKWLDDIYRSELIKRGTTDTLIVEGQI